MPRKFVISLLFVSILFSQAMFLAVPQHAAQNTDVLELAAMLPDSDVVATIDGERILNVAAPNLLGGDAKKIEHLKNLMRTIENQIGLNPNEIRQIAFGLKLPAPSGTNSTDAFFKSDFTVIVRTVNPNSNLLDTWSKRIDVIAAFKEEQAPARKYIDDFRVFRDFKFEKAAPENILTATQKFSESIEKTQAISKTLDALPKLTTNAKSVADLRAKNKSVIAAINSYQALLKVDTDMKAFRAASIKLLNRWNAVTVDDGQRTVKLNGILAESKSLYPAYKQKFENAKKLESLLDLTLNTLDYDQTPAAENLYDLVNSELDKNIAALAALPVTKKEKTATLNTVAENLNILSENLNGKLVSLTPIPEEETVVEQIVPAKIKPVSFYQTLKQAESEQMVNGKRMLVIDSEKLDAPVNEQPNKETKEIEKTDRQTENPDFAVGFLDERTMVIGYERTITPFLKRDSGYKNQQAIEMLGSSQNSLLAFAVNSNVVKTFASGTAQSTEKAVGSDLFGTAMLSSLAKEINVYGSVNYDAGKVTNDITMSLGFFREKSSENNVPEVPTAIGSNNPNADNTFEIAGYQVGKDIFYDLFNSFKAVQASMTFKFEKQKVAALIRATPKVIDKIRTANSLASKPKDAVSNSKSNKLKSLPDLLTAPQLYIDLAGLLNGKS